MYVRVVTIGEFNGERWRELCAKAGLGVGAGEFFGELEKRYAEGERAYHNGEHIAECLGELDGVAGEAVDAVGLELAVWFHDAVYDPQGARNEEESARLAVEFLRACGGGVELQRRVEELVMVTKRHRAEGVRDGALMADIDLAILGKPMERFKRYEADIRREYEWVPWEVYAVKRAEILRGFLGREFVFCGESFRERYEGRARENLGWAIGELGGL